MRGLLLVVAAVAAAGLGAGCKKKPQPVAVTPPTVVAPPSTNYQAGGSVLGNAVNAAKRVVIQSDLQALGLYIFDAHSTTNKMPDANTITEQLKRDYPNLYAAVKDKTVILCWTDKFDGIWAYQAGAEKSGGLALVSPGQAKRFEADEITRMLAEK